MEIMISEEVKELVDACRNEQGLTEAEQAIVREAAEEIEKLQCIPPREYREFAELTSKATRIWAEAKKEKNFKKFAPVLKDIVGYQKKFASYRAKDGEKLYNVMLDSYEKGFDMETLDRFFDELKENIVPMLHDAAERSKKVDDSFLTADYPEQAPEEAARFLAEYVGLDFGRGVLAVSAHPFTTNLHNHDVRITTHYGESIDSSIFSVIHETGHALYELGIRDDPVSYTHLSSAGGLCSRKYQLRRPAVH